MTIELSSTQVAARLGVPKITLIKWVARGLLTRPRVLHTGETKTWIWSQADVRRAEELAGRMREKRRRRRRDENQEDERNQEGGEGRANGCGHTARHTGRCRSERGDGRGREGERRGHAGSAEPDDE